MKTLEPHSSSTPTELITTMDKSNQNQWELEARLGKARQKYLWTIGLLIGVVTGLVILTIVLGTKVSKDKECHRASSYPGADVEFHVWTHQDPFQASHHSSLLRVPSNATVFTVLEHAAAESSDFKFSMSMWELPGPVFGRYVTSIGGTSEDVGRGLFWILYELSGSPDRNNPPPEDTMAELGLDDLRVRHGKVYLFWLSAPGASSPLAMAGAKRLGPLKA